jgi:hypothetical protein
MNKISKVGLLFLLVTACWESGTCQNVVQNPSATQTINQPAGTELDINGIQTLLWPSKFRIMNEAGALIFRDMTQTDAWFMYMHNDGNSTGDIQFFGNFTNHGALMPNGYGVGSIGTASAPWGLVQAQNIIGANLEVEFIHKIGGLFRIDHPLDPLHKYLQHSFVESPDMKNVYDGMAVLDKHGESLITLPNWFQALNKDFRYQLTSIGVPGPGLYIAQEVSGNKFKIAGGKPGAKVSWQVTGIRQDEYAKDHPVQVEEVKPLDKQGKLLYQKPTGQESKDGVAKQQPQPVVPVAGTQAAVQPGNQD